MNIKEICDKLGLTIAELARKIGVGENYLYKIAAGTRPLSKRVQLQLDLLYRDGILEEDKRTSTQEPTQLHVAEAGVCSSRGQEPCDICGSVDVYQPREVIRTVHDNNHRLQAISTELEHLTKSLAAFAQFDTIIQTKVDAIVSTRSRQIIDVYNHHITAQARVMINTLQNVIRIMRDGKVSDECIIDILASLITQLEKLKGYEPPPVFH